MKTEETKSGNNVIELVSAKIKQVKEIASATYNMAKSKVTNGPTSDELNRMAESRLKICLECPHFVGNQDKKSFLDKALSSLGVFRCGKCGCALKAKVYGKDSHCPDNRW